MLGSFLSRILIIGFGSLYPAYSSFKTIRSANVKHYVRWMMYWTVFSLFSAAEYVADIFICWLPFYYEIKVLLVLWLMSSYTRGASHVYRKVLHPLLTRREIAIDQWIGDKQSQSIQILMDAGRKGVNAAAQGALSGVGALQTNAQSSGMTNASGVLGSIVSLASNAAGALNTAASSTPNTIDQDDRFEEIDESEIISSSDEEASEDDSSDDEDYQPRRTRSSSANKKKN
jgi:receptor expression-enhancing protein 1/2/3/4